MEREGVSRHSLSFDNITFTLRRSLNKFKYLFKVQSVLMDGSRMKKYCKSQGAKLAEPVDRSEIKFLGSRVKAISENFFIGIVDTHVEGEWVFLSNDGYIEETDWAPNEPTVSRAQIEDCGEIGVHGMWADVICNSSRRFICEKNAKMSPEMAANMKVACVVVILIFCFINNSNASDEDERNSKVTKASTQITSFVMSGQLMTDSISNIQGSKGFAKKLVGLSGKLAPMLGGLGGALLLVSLFLPSSPSAELKELRKRFTDIDNNFDKVFSRFEETQNLIQKVGLQVQFSHYELDILSLHSYLHDYLNEPMEDAQYYKDLFLNEYKSGSPTDKIYIGMTETGSLTSNIPQTVMKYTNYDRKKTQHILLEVLNLIKKGAMVETAYNSFKYTDPSYAQTIYDRWDKKFDDVINHMVEVDEQVKNMWEKAVKSDLSAKLQDWGAAMNNSELADALYAFLNDKYDWRDWHVVVFSDEIEEDKRYWISTCKGFIFRKKQGKNVMVSSVDKTHAAQGTELYNDIKRVKVCYQKWHGGISTYDASKSSTFSTMTRFQECGSAVDFGLIDEDDDKSDLQHRAPEGRLAKKKKHKYLIHAFG
ncbi:hypothetical protein FSP39_017101 [Pinctada imbricata]|uniref:C-type lectin domain-containing protein n=1 Tax=Pinctada imbricata TaxID=66713 RepID=A0AA88Y0W8_PINIB|nr:hypothetical protein FSP39_017101 [Pinctada imbricata]